MEAVIREAPIGQLVRFLTNNKYLQYPEEKPGFELPEPWIQIMQGLEASKSHTENPESRDQRQNSDQSDAISHTSTLQEDCEMNAGDLEKIKSIPITPKKTKDGAILVDWYYTDDAENPHNWSNLKRGLLATIICLYTFVVYTTSAIYTASEQGIMKEFGVSEVVVTLGLSLYVLGYGTGPLIFSPLSEIPIIGRNPVYIITMFLFVIISIPTAFVGNFPGLIVLRFLQGFFGSPCLASGGASIGDMYSLNALPYAMMAWVAAAYCGPALGPLLSGFAVPAESWRWSLFESIWASAPVFIIMLVFLPETSTPTILLRRAQRLRKIYNNERFMSQSEIDQKNMRVSDIAVDALIKPMEITIKDPAVLFVQIYTAIIYGIYYSFFEVFPLVYPVDYHMNLGQVGLVFLCILVSCILGVGIYFSYLYFWMNPRIARLGWPVQESRLLPALPASFGPTIGLFLFAWTARASIHWIVPTIGITIYGATVFIVMQCIFVYIPLSYPKYAASLFAANDFFRSALACGSVMFAHPLFANLGVARGTSLLGGLSVIGIIGIWLLYFYGSRLRALSKFAISAEE
ncbi:major facilitator superfamily domain-containing protein [Penicillium longicatenatum]|uniref:major facilitator superfamily domain-containing protein n=1 Tax=Penicillium longicatenatum TaxID=1561947 RepID=UPI0025484C14|nr:major facilitator superfamily domain-containing protein [Penicillium longicatenatum]KAJ5648868.1 major facilitator superfamily domain-containing protein [Penicillium longicatenatum]